MDYDNKLKEQYGALKIALVKHDTSFGGLPAYIEVHLEKRPKDLGLTALDLSNYISRTLGLSFELVPEYRGRGKATTIRWFMNKEQFERIRPHVLKVFNKDNMTGIPDYIPCEFNTLLLQGKPCSKE